MFPQLIAVIMISEKSKCGCKEYLQKWKGLSSMSQLYFHSCCWSHSHFCKVKLKFPECIGTVILELNLTSPWCWYNNFYRSFKLQKSTLFLMSFLGLSLSTCAETDVCSSKPVWTLLESLGLRGEYCGPL